MTCSRTRNNVDPGDIASTFLAPKEQKNTDFVVPPSALYFPTNVALPCFAELKARLLWSSKVKHSGSRWLGTVKKCQREITSSGVWNKSRNTCDANRCNQWPSFVYFVHHNYNSMVQSLALCFPGQLMILSLGDNSCRWFIKRTRVSDGCSWDKTIERKTDEN